MLSHNNVLGIIALLQNASTPLNKYFLELIQTIND